MSDEQLSPTEASELIRSLLHKEGTWVDWGKSCQSLQKAGYSSQSIFEQTGFQASQQNLIIVAAQVYESITKGGASAAVLSYFLGPRSDLLYELRILNQQQRAEVAELAMVKGLDLDGIKEVAKAVKELERLSQLPAGFERHPGDAIAYFCWKRAKQQKDLQQRSKYIAQGLKFAHSPGAREAIEKLLSDFTLEPVVPVPLLPVYRLEAEEELPQIIPVAGSFPLTKAAFEATPSLVSQEPFRLIEVTSPVNCVPLPGWPVLLKAFDPVVIFAHSEQLPQSIGGKPETVLVVVDRQVREWNALSYFLIEQQEQLSLQWFPEDPSVSILGQLLLILRPKKIVDENVITEPWQMDD